MASRARLAHPPFAAGRPRGGRGGGARAARAPVSARLPGVLRRLAVDELAVPAPRPRMVRHPDVGGETPQHTQTSLAVGILLWILHPFQHSGVAYADDGQHAVAV